MLSIIMNNLFKDKKLRFNRMPRDVYNIICSHWRVNENMPYYL
jgi:hypothetical protein